MSAAAICGQLTQEGSSLEGAGVAPVQIDGQEVQRIRFGDWQETWEHKRFQMRQVPLSSPVRWLPCLPVITPTLLAPKTQRYPWTLSHLDTIGIDPDWMFLYWLPGAGERRDCLTPLASVWKTEACLLPELSKWRILQHCANVFGYWVT